jgi:hypothetical protein
MYYRKNMQLRSFDVETDVDALVHDFSGIVVGGTTYTSATWFIWNGEEGNTDSISRYWPFMIGQSNVNQAGFFVYDMVTDTVISSRKFTNGSTVNNVMMSPSGNYVYAAYNPGGDYVGDQDNPGIYPKGDLTAGAFVQSAAGVPHAAWGVSIQGPNGTYHDTLAFTRADGGGTVSLLGQGAMNPSWANPNYVINLLSVQSAPSKHGWGFLSTYDRAPTTDWARNSIFAVEIDETKDISGASDPPNTAATTRIWRVAWTQNLMADACYYFQQPNAAMNVAGTRIFWGSDWRNATCGGTDRPMDVLQAELPSTWYTDLSGGGAASPKYSLTGATRRGCN